MKAGAYNDDDIPIAIASPAFAADHQQGSRTLLTKGRSSRVVIPESSDPTGSAHLLTEDEIRALKAQGFTMGLIHAMTRNNRTFPLRFWVVDNSGT